MIEEVWAEVQPMWFTVAISSLNVRLLFHVIIFMLSVRKHHIWHIRAKRKGGLEVRCLCVCMYVCVCVPYLSNRILFFEAFASAL